jgi:hypothetical protein
MREAENVVMDAVIWVVVLAGIVAVIVWGVRSRGSGGRRPSGIGSAAVGTVYDMLNEDRRKAVEIIVEGRAEARDPEDKDGNLPDLEHRGRR